MSDINIPERHDYEQLTPFKLFVKSNFPFIEATFEALDNYGLYCEIVKYLNKVIGNQNKTNEDIITFTDFVTNYFENLDVQEEINNKLDEMASTGVLQNLINNIFENLENQIQSVASGAPSGVYSSLANLQSADPDHSKIYVVTDDGYWYYYNNTTSTWTRGGIYQASVNTADVNIMKENIDLLNKITRHDDMTLSQIAFGMYNTDGTFVTSTAQISMTTPFYITDDIKITYANGFRGQEYIWQSDDVQDGCTKTSWLTGEQIIKSNGGKWISFSLALAPDSSETLSLDTFWDYLTVESLTLNKLVDRNSSIVNQNDFTLHGFEFHSGYLIRNNGEHLTFAKGYSSDYIPIKVGDVVSAYSGTNGSNYSIISIYTINKSFIVSPLNGGANVADLVSGTYTATENGFVRFSCNIDAFPDSHFRINNVSIFDIKTIENRIEYLEKEKDSIDNLYKIFESVGVIGDSYSAVRTYYIDKNDNIQSARRY